MCQVEVLNSGAAPAVHGLERLAATPRFPAALWEFRFRRVVEGRAMFVALLNGPTLAFSKRLRACMNKQSSHTQDTAASKLFP